MAPAVRQVGRHIAEATVQVDRADRLAFIAATVPVDRPVTHRLCIVHR